LQHGALDDAGDEQDLIADAAEVLENRLGGLADCQRIAHYLS
jgi:hypothetical protein